MAPSTSGKQMVWIGRRRIGMPFFMDLPQELVDVIYGHLTNRDIKNARLAGRAFREVLILRFPRVFISPNTRNLNVFCAVMQRDELRKQVIEVVWDDARFEEQLFDDKFKKTLQENEEMLSNLDPDERKQRYEKFWGLEAKMTPTECFDRYEQFYKDQQKIIETGSDSGAFRSGLAWFPNLRRVIVTCETHRPSYLSPRYMTPMIRSFPPGFSYPLPWPWVGPDVVRLDGTATFVERSFEKRLPHWHGLYIISQALDGCQHRVVEFLVEVNKEPTGVDHRLFLQPSGILETFAGAFARLERLDLALNTSSALDWDWGCLGNGLLTATLATAHHLKHFSFQINPWHDLKGSFVGDHYVSLIDIFPIFSWYNLRHLSLLGLHVEIEDLVLFLGSLSPLVRSVELHDFNICSRHLDCIWETTLRRIKLGCPQMRKNLTIGIGLWPPGKRVWIRDRIELYFDGGANPFEKKDGKAVEESSLGVVKDDFDEC